MTDITNTFISEIVATRLSHDLIGNIGAVFNAVELWDEGSDDDILDIKNILDYSSKVLSRRLKFFRLCFGLANSSLKTVEALRSIIDDYLATLGNPNTPIELSLHITTPKIYKLIMPAVMVMADVFVKGGQISVNETDEALVINAQSFVALNQTKLSAIKKILDGQEVEDNISSYAPLYYLMEYLKGSGITIRLDGAMLIIGE